MKLRPIFISCAEYFLHFTRTPEKGGVKYALKDFQWLAGWYNWALNIFPLLRPGLANIYAKMSHARADKPLTKLYINNTIRSDLLWVGIGTGNPGVQPGLPVPIPAITCTQPLQVQVYTGTGQGFDRLLWVYKPMWVECTGNLYYIININIYNKKKLQGLETCCISSPVPPRHCHHHSWVLCGGGLMVACSVFVK